MILLQPTCGIANVVVQIVVYCNWFYADLTTVTAYPYLWPSDWCYADLSTVTAPPMFTQVWLITTALDRPCPYNTGWMYNYL